ncbi:MAG: DNA N-6-adenine-methyltransferase [Microbacteriaceae bacterium]
MTANHLTTVGSGSGEWQTPPNLFHLLDRRWAFDFDAWADNHNALCDHYATVEGTFRRGRPYGVFGEEAPYKLSGADGFAVPWKGRRVFGNPPFSRGLIEPAIRKFVDEVTKPLGETPECAVYLVPSAPDTEWYQLLKTVADITELPKRVRFIHPPFECGEKCQTGATPHELGRPLRNPPGPMVIAEARIPTAHWREILSA